LHAECYSWSRIVLSRRSIRTPVFPFNSLLKSTTSLSQEYLHIENILFESLKVLKNQIKMLLRKLFTRLAFAATAIAPGMYHLFSINPFMLTD
jgi:hypothetical protein